MLLSVILLGLAIVYFWWWGVRALCYVLGPLFIVAYFLFVLQGGPCCVESVFWPVSFWAVSIFVLSNLACGQAPCRLGVVLMGLAVVVEWPLESVHGLPPL